MTRTGLVIAAAPRSDSTLLCDTPRRTGIASRPESWFHAKSMPEFPSGRGLPPVTQADFGARSVLWYRNADGTERERLDSHGPEVFDGAPIGAVHRVALAADEGWTRWCGSEGIAPLTATNDHLATNPGTELVRMPVHLGAPEGAARPIGPGTARLAEDVSADRRDRYLALAEIQ